MPSQFGKSLHRSLIKAKVPGAIWCLRLIHRVVERFPETYVSFPPVSFDEKRGPPSGGWLLSFLLGVALQDSKLHYTDSTSKHI